MANGSQTENGDIQKPIGNSFVKTVDGQRGIEFLAYFYRTAALHLGIFQASNPKPEI